MATKTYSFEQLGWAQLPDGTPLKSVTVKEMTGEDEKKAITLASAEKNMTMVGEKLIMLSITEVNGEKVGQPWLQFTQLSVKVRKLLGDAFDDLNSVKPEETASFLSTGNITV